MMYRQGRASQFAREYLCAAEDEDTKPFKRHMLKVHPAVTRYRPRYIVCDPARTTNTKTSARTGYVVAAWEGTKLIVEDALGAFHMPNEIIETLFEWNKKYEPITVGVESNALDEFLRQPIRNEMLARHVSIPFQDLRAPHDKDAFIRGLQPFYNAGLVVHTKPLPDLENELLAYPSGRRDVVNALAYLLTLRPGNPVYSDFTEKNIQIGLKIRDDKMRFLIVSGRPALTVAAIVQLIEGVAYVIWDSIYHAPVSETFEYLYQDAIQIAGEVRLVIPREEGSTVTSGNIRYAASRMNLQITYGKELNKSEGSIRQYLQKTVKGDPAFIVSDKARWTINGMLGGYARKIAKDGSLNDNPIVNEYQILISAIESWVASLDLNDAVAYNSKMNWATAPNGQQYLTSRPRNK